eukprot:TRINITY_DN34945_c0_g1_i1.p1 TRINITY_DN34945_c0_g1~~TRINITY_DN34945_c0_g1_i1.p1  ORF type:complete len:398 (+),score=34.47 TRINITY_DN34945_c0_g1_i1:58-1194(+)
MSDTDSSSGSSPTMGIRRGLPKKATRCSADEFEEKEIKERAMSECVWEYEKKEKGMRLLAHEGAMLLKRILEETVGCIIEEICNSSKGKYSCKHMMCQVQDRAEEWDIRRVIDLTIEGGCSQHSEKGPRATNEDRMAFVPDLKLLTSLPYENCIYTAAFDGHNGTDAAETARQLLHHFVAQHLMSVPESVPPSEQAIKEALIAAFRDTHRAIVTRSEWNGSESGTTATMCLVVEGVLYTANVGDSKAVLLRNGKPVVLTQSHHVSNESEVTNIKKRGGEVIHVRGVPMVNGRIQVTRSLGFAPCQNILSQVPDISKHTLNPDDTIILGTDGLWDVFTPEEITEYTNGPVQASTTRTLALEALSRGSTDNVTVMLLRFK